MGFTIVELLAAVAIIATLSAVILAGVNIQRMKARDAHRMATLESVTRALELYHTDFGTYPDPGHPSGWADIGGCDTDFPDLELVLVPAYLQAAPTDPSGRCMWYQVVNDKQGYLAIFEPEHADTLAGDYDCFEPTALWYCIGENWKQQ